MSRWADVWGQGAAGALAADAPTRRPQHSRLAVSETRGYDGIMKNITLTLDDATYALVEQKAVASDTSVSRLIAEHLRQWSADEDATEHARRSMTALFARPDWRFAVGTADDREQRNARS